MSAVGFPQPARSVTWRDREPVTRERLSLAEFAFPGPQRDASVSAVRSGQEVATTSLLLEYELDGEPLPVPAQHSIVVDSSNRPVAVIETIERLRGTAR